MYALNWWHVTWPMTARYVMSTTDIYGVSFTLWIATWPTHRELVGSVETPVIFFTVCGPKFTTLIPCAHDRLQFAVPFSVRRYLVSFGRYSWSSFEIVRNSPPNLTFWVAKFFGGPKFPTQFYKFGSPSNTICQNLVTIDRANSQIRDWKRTEVSDK